jgi:hypothetical protein
VIDRMFVIPRKKQRMRSLTENTAEATASSPQVK